MKSEHEHQYEYFCKQPSKRPMSSSMPIQVPPRQIRQNLNQLFGLYDNNQTNDSTINSKTTTTTRNKTGDIYEARFQHCPLPSAQAGSGINCQPKTGANGQVALGGQPNNLGLMAAGANSNHHLAQKKKGQHSSTLSSSAGSTASSSSTSTANHQQGQQTSSHLDLDGNSMSSYAYDEHGDAYLGDFDEEFHQDDYYYFYSDDSNSNHQQNNNDTNNNYNNNNQHHISNSNRRTSFDSIRQYHTNNNTNDDNRRHDDDQFDDDENDGDHEENDDSDYDDFFNQEYNESHQNRYLRDKDFDEEPPRAGDDPMKLFESIQALARSLHKNSNLVGSLPPKRLIASPVRSLALA